MSYESSDIVSAALISAIVAGAVTYTYCKSLKPSSKSSSASSDSTAVKGNNKGEVEFIRKAFTADKANVLEKRRKYSSKTQSVTYNDPLMIMKGEGAYLYDEKGIKYLDSRNNVGHVGWQHPKWHQAVCNQLALTNTNTRYLHPIMVQLAERLLAMFPEHISKGGKVFFTNSGSESNELALRLAKAHSRHNGVITLDHAYHGWTSSTVGISPYKKYGIIDVKPRVYCVPCPDTFAGEYRVYEGGKFTEEEAGILYAKKIEEMCKEMIVEDDKGNKHSNVACFFMESGMGVGGVILPPKGFMKHAFAAVRAAGGVCVCDEVQTGFGRIGSGMWAFQSDGTGVCPDIVTMGKPFGNGFPIGAVVCTKEINESFEKLGMEFFSTFGGNPAACAAGTAVLDIMEEEHLQENAQKVGEFMKKKLAALQKKGIESKHNVIVGDVRGRGLFLGIELVLRCHRGTDNLVSKDEVPLAADPETKYIQDRLLKVHKIITNVDGPRHNVLVIKPPMCFSEENAEYFIDSIEESINYLQANPATPN